MDDLIRRKQTIDAIRASTSKYTGFMEMEMYTDDDAVEAINGVPSIDAVPVIRCKDCKWRDTWVCSISTKDDWFCPKGERKDNE